MPYGFFVTDKGKELIASSMNGEKLAVTKVSFGSGGDPSSEKFDYTVTDLESQFYEKPLDATTDFVNKDKVDPNLFELIVTVPDTVSGTISEIGYKDENDNLILYGLVQKQVKEATTGVTFEYRNYIFFENEERDVIEFKMDIPVELEDYVRKADVTDTVINVFNSPEDSPFVPLTDEEIEQILNGGA